MQILSAANWTDFFNAARIEKYHLGSSSKVNDKVINIYGESFFELSKEKTKHFRKTYNLLDLLGDVGGLF